MCGSGLSRACGGRGRTGTGEEAGERRRPSPHLPGDQAQGLFLSQGLPDRWDTESSGCSHPTPSLLGLGGLPCGDAAACVWVLRACGGPPACRRKLVWEGAGALPWLSPQACVLPRKGVGWGPGSSPAPLQPPNHGVPWALCVQAALPGGGPPGTASWAGSSQHPQVTGLPSASRVTLLKARGPDGLPANFCEPRFPTYDMGSCPLKGVLLEGLSWGVEGMALRKQKQERGQRW